MYNNLIHFTPSVSLKVKAGTMKCLGGNCQQRVFRDQRGCHTPVSPLHLPLPFLNFNNTYGSSLLGKKLLKVMDKIGHRI